MRIVWLINLPLPEASHLMGEQPSPFGGWLINAAKDISNQNGIELCIVFPHKRADNFRMLKGNKIKYYPFKPIQEGDNRTIEKNAYFESVLVDIKPDIVHIYGTELPHTLSMINVCKTMGIDTVVSIQGLVSIYAKHIYANLPFHAIYGFTLRNLFRKDNVYLHKKTFESRGEIEIEALKKTNHIIGRTTWDKACAKQINSEAKYHLCNETLREEFYKHHWNFNKCEEYSIFLSQGQYPIKGLHYMLEAMPMIMERFPQTKLYVSGKDIIRINSLKDRVLKTYYGKYIKRLIKKLKLENNVIFTGPLDEKEMCQRYLKSHVFVCPSSIENSPNSLGEAMILGVPCVSSNVGGVPDMLKHDHEGYVYQSDAPYMLAHYINEIFENEKIALKFSENARKHAVETHNVYTNTANLIGIYKEILE